MVELLDEINALLEKSTKGEIIISPNQLADLTKMVLDLTLSSSQIDGHFRLRDEYLKMLSRIFDRDLMKYCFSSWSQTNRSNPMLFGDAFDMESITRLVSYVGGNDAFMNGTHIILGAGPFSADTHMDSLAARLGRIQRFKGLNTIVLELLGG